MPTTHMHQEANKCYKIFHTPLQKIYNSFNVVHLLLHYTIVGFDFFFPSRALASRYYAYINIVASHSRALLTTFMWMRACIQRIRAA